MSIDRPSESSRPIPDELDEDGLPDPQLDPRVRAVLRAVHTGLPRRPDAGTVHRHLAEMRRIRRRLRRMRRAGQVGRYGAIATAMVLVLAVAGMLPTTVQRALADVAQVVGITLPTPTDGVPASEDQPDDEGDEAEDEAGTSTGATTHGGQAAPDGGLTAGPAGDATGGAADRALLALPPLPDLPDLPAPAAEEAQQAREAPDAPQGRDVTAAGRARGSSETAPSTSADRQPSPPDEQPAPSDAPSPASPDGPAGPSGPPDATTGAGDEPTGASPTTESSGHEPARDRTEPTTVAATGPEPALPDADTVRELPLVRDRAGR